MQLLEGILQNKLLPQIERDAAKRIIVVSQRMNSAEMPPNVNLTRHKLVGKRITAQQGRLYGRARRINAVWPKSGMHEAEYSRLIFVVEGRVNFQAGDYMISCSQGDFIFIPPGIPYPGDIYSPHLISSQHQNYPCKLLWMLPYKRGFHCYLSRYENGQKFTEPSNNWLFLDGQVINFFHSLIQEIIKEKNSQICNGLLLALTASLLREVKARHYLHPGPVTEDASIHASKDDFPSQLRKYVDKNLHESLTTEKVAREFYMSRATFVRRMRSEIGQPFGEFLTMHRLQQAELLLIKSEWTIQAIAQYTGFKSTSYFHTLFRQKMQCTPSQFREKRGQKNKS